MSEKLVRKESVFRETPRKYYYRGAEGVKEQFRKYPSTDPKYTHFPVSIWSSVVLRWVHGEYHIVLFELIRQRMGGTIHDRPIVLYVAKIQIL